MPIDKLDYDLDDTLAASSPEQLKALGDDTRLAILDLLLERSASTGQLAEALDKPKSTVAHHLSVLHDTGLVKVVRTRQVRAITEKFFGRTARTFVLGRGAGPGLFMRRAIAEVEQLEHAELDPEEVSGMFTLRHARVPKDRADEYAARLAELSEEFTAEPRHGSVVYGLLLGLYPTRHAGLPEDGEDE